MTLCSSLRSADRRLRTAPGFAAIAILTLAIGIGSTVAIFSLVNTVLLRPLPFPEAEGLVGLWHTAPGLELEQIPMSPGLYLHYRDEQRAFTAVGLVNPRKFTLTDGGEPERIDGAHVTGSTFDVLQVPPLLGRPILESDEEPGSEPVIVLSHELWQRRFGGDPAIVGRRLRSEGVTREIVGVMPATFRFPSSDTELWLPMELDRDRAPIGEFSAQGIARLRPGFELESAEGDLSRLLAALPEAFPEDPAVGILLQAGFAALVHDMREDEIGDVRTALMVVLGAVGMIFLIACANVANLFLVRAEGRHQEIAIRSALGETRGSLVLGFLVESLLLASLAGALGLALAAAVTRLIIALAADALPRLTEHSFDGKVYGFCVGASVLAAVLFGLLPALRTTVPGLATELTESGLRTTAGRGRRKLRGALVVGQVAISLVLLISSGLSALSFRRLASTHPGFDASDVINFTLSLPRESYPDARDRLRFHDGILRELRTLPGVSSVGAASGLPLDGQESASGHAVEDFPFVEGEPPQVLYFQYASSDYFSTLGIPLLEGRAFNDDDHRQAARSIVISETVARFFWPESSALGKRLRQGAAPEDTADWYIVIGEVGDIRSPDLRQEPSKLVYYPLITKGDRDGDEQQSPSALSYVVETRLRPADLAGQIRSTVWGVDPNLPIAGLEAMSSKLDRSTARLGFSMVLLLISAGVALLLGAIGLYGVVSYTVSQRLREIAIRMAFGAQRTDVRRMVLREGLLLAGVGCVTGLIGAAAATRLMEAVLYQVDPLDPLVFATVPLAPLAISAAASLVPARRASLTDPARSLRA
ncbi:MAG: ABC transporter permease [Acidobacteriota bacterium]|nr:ABC transporter permease [Acidobacteriota bacterium]